MNRDSALMKGTPESSLPLPPRRTARKWALTRHDICQHFDLGLLAYRSVKKDILDFFLISHRIPMAAQPRD